MLDKLLRKELNIESLKDSDIELIVSEICSLKQHTSYLVFFNIMRLYKRTDFTLPYNIQRITRHKAILSFSKEMKATIGGDKYLSKYSCQYIDIINSDVYKNNVDVMDISNTPFQDFIDYLISINIDRITYNKLLGGKTYTRIQDLI